MVTGRNSMTRLRVSCHPSQTSEHHWVRQKDGTVFGCPEHVRKFLIAECERELIRERTGEGRKRVFIP